MIKLSSRPGSRSLLAIAASVLCLAISSASVGHAQPFRFMDESGNLHWVDSLHQIPAQYRNQVLVPTPVPSYKGRRGNKPPKAVKTKKPRPTKKPKKSLQEAKAQERVGGKPLRTEVETNPALSGPPPDGVANPAAAAALDRQKRAAENEVAFDGATAQGAISIVAKP